MYISILNMKCEGLVNPLGIDNFQPRLSWKISQGQRGLKQDSYRVIVSTDLDKAKNKIGDAYDSGVIRSCDPFCYYKGEPLQSATKYYWQVELAFQNGEIIFSDIASFETGLLHPDLWQGRWLGTPTSNPGVILFRKTQQLGKKIASARAYLAAEGFAELWINGTRLNTGVLEPVNSDYNKQVYYLTFDITKNLQTGNNAIGVALNPGWSAHPKFLLQINVTFTDNTTQSIVSEFGDWVFISSPITLATLYSGENYDPAYECPEWNRPDGSFEEKYHLEDFSLFCMYRPHDKVNVPDAYKPYLDAYFYAIELPAPKGVLMAQPTEPIRAIAEIKPVSFKKAENGAYVFDFGQNFAGVVKLRIKGEKDTFIKLEHTELLNDDGTPNMVYLRVAEPNYPYPMQTDTYILKGTGEIEEYMPRFTYHGFRFVAVYGLTEEPTLDLLTGYMIASDVTTIGRFECDNDMINWIQEAIMWTERSNLHGIPTDCPQRAERQGWLNDMTARSEGAVYNLDLQLLYTKWVRDIRGTQDDFSGAIADTAPFRRGNFPADAVVTSYLLVPYLIYQHYGDIRPIKDHYQGLKGWCDYLLRNSHDGIACYSLYGDWAGPEPHSFNGTSPVSAITPGAFMSSGFNYMNAKLMAQFASYLGKTSDKEYYLAVAERVKNSINKKYFNPQTANYALGSQGANTFALYLGIVPEGYEERVAKNIVDDIIAHDYHLTTGNIATKYLPEILTEYGYVDIAVKLMNQTTYPSWGYMREMGATTIWERWEYATGFAMNSHSHPMYGSITAWFYKYLAGISPVKAGFAKAQIKPYIPTELNTVSASVDTIYGQYAVAWEKKDGYLTVNVTIPTSACAKICIPGTLTVYEGEEAVWQNGHKERLPEGITEAYLENGRVVFEAEAGTYSFRTKL